MGTISYYMFKINVLEGIFSLFSFSSYPIIMMNSIYRVYVSGILGSFVS